jgi:hypothetical protein
MPLTCPIGLDVARLRDEVQATYARVALTPDGSFHFHRGPQYAATRLGYDATELASLPADVTGSFAGVGNPHAIAPLATGATVLEMGCGAGTDLLLAARHVGPGGPAIGVDDAGDAVGRRRGRGLVRLGPRGNAARRRDQFAGRRRLRRHGDFEWRPQSRARQAAGHSRDLARAPAGWPRALADIAIGVRCRMPRLAISISGRVESPVLCRRQSSWRRFRTPGSTTCGSMPDSTVLLGQPGRRRRDSTASSA